MLLYEDGFCYIVENGNRHLVAGDSVFDGKKRYSLTVKEHISRPKDGKLIKKVFLEFLRDRLHLENGEYVICETMGTYPDHYHVHAYVLPFHTEVDRWAKA